MKITEFARQYHEKMFPGYESKLLETDPEFIERFDNFAFCLHKVAVNRSLLAMQQQICALEMRSNY